jgi:hypothetical protein
MEVKKTSVGSIWLTEVPYFLSVFCKAGEDIKPMKGFAFPIV